MTIAISVVYFILFQICCALNCSKKFIPESDEKLIIEEETFITVNVSLSLEEIRFTSTTNMEYEVTLLLHQRWFDPSLGSNLKTQQKAVNGQIWRPKINPVNGCFQACNNLENTQYWRGFGNEGNVLLSEKFVLKSSCTRNYRKYPFDIQICELKFGTYIFPVNEVDLLWEKDSVKILSRTHFDEFELTNVTVYNEIDVRPFGNFKILAVQFFMKRHFTNYVLSVITSCTLLVLISYASFWIDNERLEFRMSMCLGTTLMNELDLFFLTCLIFLVFSFFENCLISYLLTSVRLVDKRGVDYHKVTLWIQLWVKVLYPILYVTSLLLYLYQIVH